MKPVSHCVYTVLHVSEPLTIGDKFPVSEHTWLVILILILTFKVNDILCTAKWVFLHARFQIHAGAGTCDRLYSSLQSGRSLNVGQKFEQVFIAQSISFLKPYGGPFSYICRHAERIYNIYFILPADYTEYK